MILQTNNTLNDLNSIYSIERGFFSNKTSVNTLFNYNKVFEKDDKIQKIISNDSLSYYLDLIDKKQISMSKVARIMKCSRQWVSTLYNRYKKGLKLHLKKGHRKQVLTKEMKKKIAEIYLDLFYDYEDIKHVPSMKILKKVASEKINNFPEVHIETIRKTLKEQNVYVDKSGIKKYRKKFYTGSVGELVNGGIFKNKWISNNNECYLIIFSDEKSKYILYAKIVKEDNLENHYSALKDIVLTFGLPSSLYYKNKLNNSDLNDENKYLKISSTLNKLNINTISSKLYQLQYKHNPINNFDIFRKQLKKMFKNMKPKSIYNANGYLLDFIEKFNSTYSILINDKPEHIFKENIDVFKDITCNDLEFIENTFTKESVLYVDKDSKIEYKRNKYFVPYYNNTSLVSQNILVKESPDKWIKLYYDNNFLVKYDLLYNFKN